MYDVVVIGQGLSGMLSAIWAKEQGHSVALVHQGSGKLIQATGLLDILPGTNGSFDQMVKQYKIDNWNSTILQDGVEHFKKLMNKLNLKYYGDGKHPVEVVTGSGHIKSTGLYPETYKPIPAKGKVIVVGFQEIADFQPTYAMANLKEDRPQLEVEAINVTLGKRSFRTMTQLDAARLLEDKAIRSQLIQQIKQQMNAEELSKPDLFIFPAALGVMNWKEVVTDLETGLGSAITEAAGMPPNASAVRLNEILKKELIRQGVRMYTDTMVIGSNIINQQVQSIQLKNSSNRISALKGTNYVLATGGVLGGGLEKTATGFKEQVLGIEVNTNGEFIDDLQNVSFVGASKGTKVLSYGITGGLYSILSSYQAVLALKNTHNGGTQAC